MEQHIIQPAGFWIRLAASLLDTLLILFPIGMLLTSMILIDTDFRDTILTYSYDLFLPLLWSGYTIGRYLCGIRIVQTNGNNVHLGNMLLRVVLSGIIYSITFGVAAIISLFMVILREDKRALHDIIAGTYVTYKKPKSHISE